MNYELKKQYFNIYRNIHQLQEAFQQDVGDLAPEDKKRMHMEIINMYSVVGERESMINLLNEYIDQWVTPKNILGDPVAIRAYMMLILVFVSQNSRNEAMEILDRFQTYMKYSQTDDADFNPLNMYAKILKDIISSEDVDTQQLYASINEMKGFYEKGKDRLPVDFAIVLNECLASCYFKMNDVSSGVAAWNVAMSIAENKISRFRIAEMYRRLSHLYEHAGMFREALEQYDSYVDVRDEAWNARELAYSEFLIMEYGVKTSRKMHVELPIEGSTGTADMDIDQLTGLYSRDYMKKLPLNGEKPKEWHAVMFDIDFFERYTENYGEVRGERILEKTGALLQEYASENIVPLRYDRDKFLLLMTGQSLAETEIVADTILRELRSRKYAHDFSMTGRYVTISAGIASGICGNRDQMEVLCGMADKALTEAKAGGRNMVAKVER